MPVGVLVDGDQARDAGALEVLAADQVARALGRDQRHVDVRRRHDLAVVDREPVAEHQQLPGAIPSLTPDSQTCAVELVGDEHHHDVALAGGVGGLDHAQPVLLGLGDAAELGPQPDDDDDAGVLEVQRVGVALGAVADDRDGLAVEQCEVSVVVVEHGPERTGAATARSRHPGASPARALPAAEARLERQHARPRTAASTEYRPCSLDRGEPLVVAGRGQSRIAAGRVQQRVQQQHSAADVVGRRGGRKRGAASRFWRIQSHVPGRICITPTAPALETGRC